MCTVLRLSQVLLTWECTIAHAVPWETFDPWLAKATPAARFIAAISCGQHRAGEAARAARLDRV